MDDGGDDVPTIFDELLSSVPGLSRAAGRCEPVARLRRAVSTGRCRRERSTPNALACLAHLDRAAEHRAGCRAGRWSRLLARASRRICVGARPTRRPISARISSTITAGSNCSARAAISSMTAIAAGFLILGPDIVYPDHHHVAEEIYIPLTGGTEWRMGEGAFRGARGRRDHPPSLPTSTTPCAPAPSRCWRSISGAAGRWRRNRPSARPAGGENRTLGARAVCR